MARTVQIEILADTSQFEQALRRARILVERSWWRRTLLRVALWRADRMSR